MFDKIKQLKELRDQAQQIKKMLAEETVRGEAGHESVTVVMDGNQEVLAININQNLLNIDKKEELEKNCQEAMNDAIKKSQRVMAQKMHGMGGLNIPGL